MKCPKCSSLKLSVMDSRPSEDRNAIRRRRECLECKERFTTMETLYSSSKAHVKPKIVAKTPQSAKAKSAIKRNVSAMFKNESRRESRYYDAWGPDNDYLGKL